MRMFFTAKMPAVPTINHFLNLTMSRLLHVVTENSKFLVDKNDKSSGNYQEQKTNASKR